jgi:hypothetical protein
MATRPRRGGPPGAWGPPTALPPRRPGQVVTSAVLAFVQAGLVVFASLYVLLLSSVLDMAAEQPAFPGGPAASPPRRTCWRSCSSGPPRC